MDIMIRTRFDLALIGKEYTGLVSMVNEFKTQGLTQVEIYDLFEQYMFALQAEKRGEEDIDRVADVMDFIVGWCSSDTKLFSSYLTNEEIENFKKRQLS